MKTNSIPFAAAEILLPKASPETFSVIACDQHTSDPDYWEQVEKIVSGHPSAYHMMLPEIYLGQDDAARTRKINATMQEYLSEEVFQSYPDAMIYVERTLPSGMVRRGLIGMIDLEAYDYTPGAQTFIRPTEGTVPERIPPRVAIRQEALLEMPHVMLLMDDRKRTVIEPLSGRQERPIYDFDLMLGGGHLRGYLLDSKEQSRILAALGELAEGENPLLFAVGDGNHSLAAARASYLANPNPHNRYSLVELVNIHDPALVFEPIYRVVFGCEPQTVFEEAANWFMHHGNTLGEPENVIFLADGVEKTIPSRGFAVGVLQAFLNDYTASHPSVRVDYVHGEAETRSLAKKSGVCAFLFRGMQKSDLFPCVRRDGVLPRKAFSMGEAAEKRYYLEGRKIR